MDHAKVCAPLSAKGSHLRGSRYAGSTVHSHARDVPHVADLWLEPGSSCATTFWLGTPKDLENYKCKPDLPGCFVALFVNTLR